MISSTHRIKTRFSRDSISHVTICMPLPISEKRSPVRSDKLLRQRTAANYRQTSSHHLDTISRVPRVEHLRNFEDPKQLHVMPMIVSPSCTHQSLKTIFRFTVQSRQSQHPFRKSHFHWRSVASYFVQKGAEAITIWQPQLVDP
jgi:hypothetical protein